MSNSIWSAVSFMPVFLLWEILHHLNVIYIELQISFISTHCVHGRLTWSIIAFYRLIYPELSDTVDKCENDTLYSITFDYCKILKFGDPLCLRISNFQELVAIYFGYYLVIPYIT